MEFIDFAKPTDMFTEIIHSSLVEAKKLLIADKIKEAKELIEIADMATSAKKNWYRCENLMKPEEKQNG